MSGRLPRKAQLGSGWGRWLSFSLLINPGFKCLKSWQWITTFFKIVLIKLPQEEIATDLSFYSPSLQTLHLPPLCLSSVGFQAQRKRWFIHSPLWQGRLQCSKVSSDASSDWVRQSLKCPGGTAMISILRSSSPRFSSAFLRQPDATVGPWGPSSSTWSSHSSGWADWTSWTQWSPGGSGSEGQLRSWYIGLTTGWLGRVEKREALIPHVGWFLEGKYSYRSQFTATNMSQNMKLGKEA